MNVFPLETERLRLRPWRSEDAPRLADIVNVYEIAANTLTIPHPYHLSDAEAFIAKTRTSIQEGTVYSLCVTLKSEGVPIGSCGIGLTAKHRRGEIGYWIGKAYWGQGYASEAARRIVQFGFERLKLMRIQATYFPENPASRRVMEKAGMVYEGTLRNYVQKWGDSRDLGMCAITREAWLKGADGTKKGA